MLLVRIKLNSDPFFGPRCVDEKKVINKRDIVKVIRQNF